MGCEHAGGGNKNQNPNLRDVNVTVEGQGLDMIIPTIPKPNKADIKAGFKTQVLTAIKGKSTYEKMKTTIYQLVRNARTVKVFFRGGARGACTGYWGQ